MSATQNGALISGLARARAACKLFDHTDLTAKCIPLVLPVSQNMQVSDGDELGWHPANRRLFMLNFSASAIAFYGSTIAIFSFLTALFSSFALLAPSLCEVARMSPCLAPSPPQPVPAPRTPTYRFTHR